MLTISFSLFGSDQVGKNYCLQVYFASHAQALAHAYGSQAPCLHI